MVNVLVVEDDKNLRKLISTILKQNGYVAFEAENGRIALNIMEHEHIDLLITDIMMPDMDGYELTETIRSANNLLPVLMITAKETFHDKQRGFLAGTDDYMVKPIDLNEMILRVKALLRRSKIASERKLTIGNIVLDYDSLSVTMEGEIYTLPPKEFYLLFKLLSYPNVVFTRLQLMDEIWGMDAEADERTVDVHIKRLREKFENCSEFKIVTVRGLGYKAERIV